MDGFLHGEWQERLRSDVVIAFWGERVIGGPTFLFSVHNFHVSGTDVPGGGHPWGRTLPSPPGALGCVVNPHPLGSTARGGVGMPGGECPTP